MDPPFPSAIAGDDATAAHALVARIANLSPRELPVLRVTACNLARLAAEGDDRLGARDYAKVLLRDPLATARVYVQFKEASGQRALVEITTVERIIVMLGLTPFMRSFAAPPLAETLLGDDLEARSGLIRVIHRARHAAAIAGVIAAWRNDTGFEEIMVAALLHDLAEMLVWISAPRQACLMQRRLDADSRLRSVAAQQQVLGFHLHDLQLDLVRRWRLPELLVSMMDDAHAEQPRVRNVVLAVNIARHSIHDWDNAALPDDYREVAALLSIPAAQAREMIEGNVVQPALHP